MSEISTLFMKGGAETARGEISRREEPMMATLDKKREGISCPRCGGKMITEKFYDVNSVFYGWHCVMCGEILDPIILLHRLSQNADLEIPDGEENVMHLLKSYLQARPKRLETAKV